MALARQVHRPLAAVLCWVLLALFAGGHQPSRAQRCACTAAHNCGCSCWQGAPPGERPAGERGGCCARRSAAGEDCPGEEGSPAAPAPGGGHHRTARLDWDGVVPPHAAAPPTTCPLAPGPDTTGPDWSPEPPDHPPRAGADVRA